MQIWATPDARRLIGSLTAAGRVMITAGLAELQRSPVTKTIGVPWGATCLKRIPKEIHVGFEARTDMLVQHGSRLCVDIVVVAPTWQYREGRLRLDNIPDTIVASLQGRRVHDVVGGDLLENRDIVSVVDAMNPCVPDSEGRVDLVTSAPSYEVVSLDGDLPDEACSMNSSETKDDGVFSGKLTVLLEGLPPELAAQVRAIAKSHRDAMIEPAIGKERRLLLQSAWLMPRWTLHHSETEGTRIIPEAGNLKSSPVMDFLEHYASINPQRNAA